MSAWLTPTAGGGRRCGVGAALGFSGRQEHRKRHHARLRVLPETRRPQFHLGAFLDHHAPRPFVQKARDRATPLDVGELVLFAVFVVAELGRFRVLRRLDLRRQHLAAFLQFLRFGDLLIRVCFGVHVRQFVQAFARPAIFNLKLITSQHIPFLLEC